MEVGAVIISLILSIIALITSISSNNKSNTITEKQFSFEQQRSIEEKKEKSIDNVNKVYDQIMYTTDLYEMRKIISDWQLFEWKTKIRLLIDELEWLWDKYCKQQVYTDDLKILDWLLSKTCTHHQIVDMFQWKKNWFSKICLDIVWEKGMWLHYQDKNDCQILK